MIFWIASKFLASDKIIIREIKMLMRLLPRAFPRMTAIIPRMIPNARFSSAPPKSEDLSAQETSKLDDVFKPNVLAEDTFHRLLNRVYEHEEDRLCEVHLKRLHKEVASLYFARDQVSKLQKDIHTLEEVKTVNSENFSKLKKLYEEQVEETKRVYDRGQK